MSGEEPVELGGAKIVAPLVYPTYPFSVPSQMIGIGLGVALLVTAVTCVTMGIPQGLLGLFAYPVWHAYWAIKSRRNPYYFRSWFAYFNAKPKAPSAKTATIGKLASNIIRYG